MIEFAVPEGMPPTAGYSHVVSVPADCRMVWTSGQVGLDADGVVVGEDWESQTRQVFRNLGTALDSAGATWSDVVKLTYYVVDTSGLAVVRAIRDEFVDVTKPPTSSAVRVAGLFRPDLLIEIEAVAAVASNRA